VDVAKMKAEFLQQYYDRHGIPLRSRLIGAFSRQMKWASRFPALFNGFFGVPVFRKLANRIIGFHPERTLPRMAGQTLRHWFRKRVPQPGHAASDRKVFFFCDEFTNYNDAEIGKKAILLLEGLGYTVMMPDHGESGRTWLSKGLLRKARAIANRNIRIFSSLVTERTPLIGLEPSAILSFRDEYVDLADEAMLPAARELASHCFTLEEFIAREAREGRIDRNRFHDEKKYLLVHGHCYQKALSDMQHTIDCLQLPTGYAVTLIPSGCCGMAGSFGYEREHYPIAQAIGELVLFPAVRSAAPTTFIVAAGTSCRHQVKDGTGKQAHHPAEILHDALRPNTIGAKGS
jgi:Fe-S oxidoreductase